jgi:hypothetical protein
LARSAQPETRTTAKRAANISFIIANAKSP